MIRRYFILFFIIFLGFALRVWNVETIPPGLNRDEASIGYTAYSLLLTAKDEYGKFLPLSVKSFGDWKLPLYIYLDILPVHFFSLSEFSVRFPSLFFGTLTIPFVYFIVVELFRDRKNARFLGLIAAFLFTLSPWHIHFSRVASEANISVFFISVGFFLFLKGIRSSIFLLFSALLFSGSLYTYHGNHVFTPIFVVGLLIILWRFKAKRKAFFLFLLPFALSSFLIYKETIFSADTTKIAGLASFSDEFLVYNNVVLPRLDHSQSFAIITKIYHNKLTFLIENFINGYVRSFSSDFLFIRGGENLQHNIPNFGNLYIWEIPFLIFGIYFLFKKQMRWRFFLLFWLLIAPIPAAITKDAPHSARMLSLLPLPHILSAIGFGEFVSLFSYKAFQRGITSMVLILLGINFGLYLDRYFIHFPKVSETYWGGGYKELISSLSEIAPDYNEVIMDRPNYSPYIYFLFYQKTDPAKFRQEVIRYPEDKEGFQHVLKLSQRDKLAFKPIHWAEDILVPDRLLVSWAESTPPSATKSALLVDRDILSTLDIYFGKRFGYELGDIIYRRIVKTVKLKNGQDQFYLIEIKRIARGTQDIYDQE